MYDVIRLYWCLSRHRTGIKLIDRAGFICGWSCATCGRHVPIVPTGVDLFRRLTDGR